jgi:DNA-3-methyladenine glycosylase II
VASEQRSAIHPVGPFDLARSIAFLEEWPVTSGQAERDSALRFAFCLENDWRPVGVRVTQHGDRVDVEASGPGAAAETVVAQVARVLSLDVDATVVDEIAERDPVVARLVAAAPGLRPVCFWTPWEAACWAVLSQRTSMRTAAVLKQRIARDLGPTVAVDGRELIVFPSPEVVLGATELPGVNALKLERIHGLAAAASDGRLTAGALRSASPVDALDALRRLPGVGPFSAALILIRGAGAPDVFTTSEARLLSTMRGAYSLSESAGDDDYRAIAEAWRPLRSWVAFWLRSRDPRSASARFLAQPVRKPPTR